MPRYKKEKEYSTSYEKKISINPMVEAFNMDEDNAPIAGAIGRATTRVGEFTPSGRVITAMRKNPKASSGLAGAAGGTGAGYVAGRYDGENYTSEENARQGAMEPPEEKMEDKIKKQMKKGGMTKAQKKIGTVMREFKKGKLHSGKSGAVVKNPKQAIAIALSEAGKSKPMKKRGGGIATAGMGAALQKGGMVRGQGIALRGTKFKGVF